MPPQFGGGPKCGVCQKTVYFNEERRAVGKVFHVACFKCGPCNKSLDSTTCNEHEGKLYCKGCYGKQFGPRGYGFAGGAAGLSTSAGQPGPGSGPVPAPSQTTGNKDDPENCPRCGSRVYFAEQVLALNRKWHKTCFKCSSCNKSVDSTSAADHEGELFCKGCYGRHFGPKGVGYGIGAGTLHT